MYFILYAGSACAEFDILYDTNTVDVSNANNNKPKEILLSNKSKTLLNIDRLSSCED